MLRYLLPSFVLLMLLPLASSSYIQMSEPYSASLSQNGSAYLGNVGPGQTFYITILSNTTNAKGQTIPLGWNKLVATSVPEGWIVSNSSLYTQTLSVEIRPSPAASFGEYTFNLTAINLGNYSGINPVTFKAYINVTPNVFKFNATPQDISAGLGVPAYIYVTINNTGVSDNPFVITVSGLPGFNQSATVIAPHSTTGRFTFPIYENTPYTWHAKLRISSLTSPSIYETENITFTVRATLMNDIMALNQGTLIYPVVYAPVYAVQYLIGLIAKHA